MVTLLPFRSGSGQPFQRFGRVPPAIANLERAEDSLFTAAQGEAVGRIHRDAPFLRFSAFGKADRRG